MISNAVSAEPVIVGAEIAAGHDGAADLVLRLRHPNGVEETVTLDGEHGLALMNRCGIASLDDLPGHSWRKILEAS
ncbi:hypothetical protein [Phenylobacterium sp.]|uniref:hypothetical protein n=1 Tax=Phenylobacterium sp. TaxID=1871053 RepID=UPI00286A6103|nr:hypothetical protein [Phenylobacterium sp.]